MLPKDCPSVHGRPNKLQFKRYHQRNLSLDYRSMGILLPPVSQVSLTPLHQRNRSLDSVLQQIPEVDVTPSPENEPPSLLPMEIPRSHKGDISSMGSDDSGIVCRSDANISHDRSNGEIEDSDGEDSAVTEYEKDAFHIDDSFLLRLFRSTLFDASMAVTYLFNSKEPEVQSYIGKKLFCFPNEDVDFYLPQLICMFTQMQDVAEVLNPYLIYRCKDSLNFSLKCAWLLDAYEDSASLWTEESKARKLMKSILSEEIRIDNGNDMAFDSLRKDSLPNVTFKKMHHRARSDASALRTCEKNHFSVVTHLGDLSSGRAFDNGCKCSEMCLPCSNDLKGADSSCHCHASKLAPQVEFVKALTNVGQTLASLPTLEARTARLVSDLSSINLNLPAKVWLPSLEEKHYVVKIPPQMAVVLNSKDKAPYFLCMEVVNETDYPLAIGAERRETLRRVKSEENFPLEWSDHKLVGKRGKSSTSFVACVGGMFRPLDVRNRLVAKVEKDESFLQRGDPSAHALKESWDVKMKHAREMSPFGNLPSWKLVPTIVKTGDDLRQELLASQLSSMFRKVWEAEGVPLWLYPYSIVCLSRDAGLVEPITNTVSLHQIKKHCGLSLSDYFSKEYGSRGFEALVRARGKFVESCAAYSLLCYLLQVKDRHNGNILLNGEGCLIHVDFGYILSTSPRNLGFESSPFKLTPDFVDVMGGYNSEDFARFKALILKGFLAARKHMDSILNLVEITRSAGSGLPCFKCGMEGTRALKNRFHLNKTEEQLRLLVDNLVEASAHSLSTKLYDGYQYFTNGIL